MVMKMMMMTILMMMKRMMIVMMVVRVCERVVKQATIRTPWAVTPWARFAAQLLLAAADALAVAAVIKPLLSPNLRCFPALSSPVIHLTDLGQR